MGKTQSTLFSLLREEKTWRELCGNQIQTQDFPAIVSFEKALGSLNTERSIAASPLAKRMGIKDPGHAEQPRLLKFLHLRGGSQCSAAPLCSPWHFCDVSVRAGISHCWCCSSQCSASPPRTAAISGSWPRWDQSDSEVSHISPSVFCRQPGWLPLWTEEMHASRWTAALTSEHPPNAHCQFMSGILSPGWDSSQQPALPNTPVPSTVCLPLHCGCCPGGKLDLLPKTQP